MDEKKYDKGQLVRILVRAKECTEEGYAVIGTGLRDNSTAILYENINLATYPSCNDFLGRQTVVRHGDLATVLSYQGHPWQFQNSPRWDCYDVYEVLINGNICHAFMHSLEPIANPTSRNTCTVELSCRKEGED